MQATCSAISYTLSLPLLSLLPHWSLKQKHLSRNLPVVICQGCCFKTPQTAKLKWQTCAVLQVCTQQVWAQVIDRPDFSWALWGTTCPLPVSWFWDFPGSLWHGTASPRLYPHKDFFFSPVHSCLCIQSLPFYKVTRHIWLDTHPLQYDFILLYLQ